MTNAFSPEDSYYMARALRLAERGLYTTEPNPRVGCVLVKDGQIIGEGWHKKAGELHAERNALAVAGDAAEGCTAYVTLEPCSHYGRTPPCSLGLIEAKVSRVVAAMQDPNPLVAGKGIKMLEEAGIQVDVGLMEQQATAINPGFIKRMSTGMPYVRCKLAMSMDGRTAMANGESKWITGPEARADVQRMRARSSVVLTGIGTVLADDPSMNVRAELDTFPGTESEDYRRQPIRAVLDSQLHMPLDAQMLSLPGQTWVLTAENIAKHKVARLEQVGAKVLQVVSDDQNHLNLQQVMKMLATEGCNEIMIEAGATLAGAALQAGLVDELVVYQASHLMGDEARGLVNLPGLKHMSQRIQMKFSDVRMVGDDIRITLHKNEV